MQLHITKVINNNVVSCLDEAGHELIVMGRGLGFGAKADGVINHRLIEKIFRIENPGEADKLEHLFGSLPPEQVEVCSRIIDYAKETLGRELNQSVYLTLTDHVGFTINRMKQGLAFPNALFTEVRTFYPQEYAVGLYALDLIHKELGIRLPDDEAVSIALHLVNAEYSSSFSATMHTTQALHDILEILNQWPDINLDRQSPYYDELIVHLKFLAMQAFTSDQEERAKPSLVQLIRSHFPKEFACACAVAKYLEAHSQRPISDEKRAYLTIFINRVNTIT